jgi:cell division protein FtsQ
MNLLVRILAWLLALALVALPGVALLKGWMASERWPLTRLVLEAEHERVFADQIRSAIADEVQAGFFAIDLARVRAAVEAQPWVRSAEVRKVWPDTLEISLVEHRAFARWGSERLLSDRGMVFRVPGVELMEGLPQLDGPDARRREVVRHYNELGERLRGTGLSIAALRLSPRGSWSLRTSDGGEWELGRGDPLPRAERFVRALPAVLAARPGEIARADLRYANGFAIRWREPADPATATPDRT